MEEPDIAHLASRPFDGLSSGRTQRILIMRAIAQEARVFLLDEPASNLDVRYRPDVMDMVAGIVRGRNAAACAIIHDLDLALRCCNKILMMRDGEVFASGPTDDVMTAENVRTVYGVDVAAKDVHGRRHVIVLRYRNPENPSGACTRFEHAPAYPLYHPPIERSERADDGVWREAPPSEAFDRIAIRRNTHENE